MPEGKAPERAAGSSDPRQSVRAEISREMGEHQRLRDLRTYFQHATEKQFCEVIERLLGRKVRSFVSGIDTEADLFSELF